MSTIDPRIHRLERLLVQRTLARTSEGRASPQALRLDAELRQLLDG